MDNVSLILAALEAAIIAGGQSALNDTIKDAFINLKDRVVQLLAGKRNADLVLQEYEHDPETWRKPLAELLIQASLSQDEETLDLAERLLKLTRSEQDANVQTNYVFHEQVQSSAVGNYNTNTFHITNNTSPIEDALAKGRNNFRRGYNALLRGEYIEARRSLEEALQLLDEEHQPEDFAQIKYCLALALLNGQRPFSTTIQNMRHIEQLLRTAITLRPLHSYYYALALFKRDFARNGLPQYKNDAQRLGQKAQNTKRMAVDDENLKLLSRCQPRLIDDSQHW